MTDQERNAMIDKTTKQLFSVGRMWATHGLTVGKLALETSAKTLQATAATLSDIKTRLED